MITEKECQNLITKFMNLREKANKTNDKSDIINFKNHEKLCIEKLKYLVVMRTSRYRNFPNYEDLTQEGLEALIKSMKNYNPTKGIFFYWAHRYIDTKIARSANLHTTIRYPLKFAKLNPPKKEMTFPIMIENRFCPDKKIENQEIEIKIDTAMQLLDDQQKQVIDLLFGLSGDKPLSVNKVCKKMKISRATCMKIFNVALNNLKENINL